jgi:hypothetical protein
MGKLPLIRVDSFSGLSNGLENCIVAANRRLTERISSQSPWHGLVESVSALSEAAAILPPANQQVEALEIDGRLRHANGLRTDQPNSEEQRAEWQRLHPPVANIADGKEKPPGKCCGTSHESSPSSASAQESNAIFSR